MNYKEHSNEIQVRLNSKNWGEHIARKVSVKIEKKKRTNRIILSVSLILLVGLISTFGYFSDRDFTNPALTELDDIHFFLSDDISPIYETIYQEESISSMIEPISFFIK